MSADHDDHRPVAPAVTGGTRRMWPLRNVGPLADAYSLTADWDNQWLTSGMEKDVIVMQDLFTYQQKGVGEGGAIGPGAAIANAVYHATGYRVRELPIAIEHLSPTG